MGGISQLPKCPPRQLRGSISLVQQDRSLPRGISLARDPGILALVPEPFSAQSCAAAWAGMGWGDENGSSLSVLSDSGVSQTGTLLLKQSFSLFIPQFPAQFPGMCAPFSWLCGQQNEGHQFLEARMLPPHKGVSLQNGQSCPKHTQPDSHSEE